MTIIGSLFAVFAALLLPLTASIWLCTRKKGYLKPVLLGAATFFVFQIMLRLPIIQYVLAPMPWFITMGILQPVLTALFYGITAALFEEGGRYIVMSLFMKKSRRFTDGLAFGAGHGGIEAILLVGVNALVMLLMGSSQGPGFAAGFERIFTMAVHIAWSVMVLKSVAEKKPLWLVLAFALHALIDTAVVLAPKYGLSISTIELCIGIFACAMILYIVISYKKLREESVK